MLATMRTGLTILTFAAGLLAVLGSALWCVAGAGIYGSPLSGMSPSEGRHLLVLFLTGPLLLLPAGFVSRRRPLAAGFLLLGSAVFTTFWHLGVVQREGWSRLFRDEPAFEAWVPLLLIPAPALLLGGGFLWTSRQDLRAFVRAVDTGANRRRALVCAAPVVAAALVFLVYDYVRRPVWTVTVEPEGKPAETYRFDPRRLPEARAGLERVFAPMCDIRPPGQGAVTLGRFTLTRRGGHDGQEPPGTSILVAERSPAGLLLTRLDGQQLDVYVEGASVSPEERAFADREALKSAQRHLVGRVADHAARAYPPFSR
jgi:hypothetical protein